MAYQGFQFEKGNIPSALLSDMDGLLLDTEQFSKISFDALARDYGIDNADAIFPQLIGLNKAAHLKIFRNTLPPSIDPDIFDEDWKTRYLALLEDDVPVKSGVADFLRHCQSLGIPMAVVTSTKTDKAEHFLNRAGLSHFFETVIGGDQVQYGKPYPDIYLKGAAAIGAIATDCLALEDSNNGVKAAHAAGAKVIQIPDLAPQSADLAALDIPLLDSVADIPSFLGWPPIS